MPTSPDPRVTPRRVAGRLGVLLVVALLVLAPSPAWAHGITDGAGDRGVLGFVPLGIEHMLLGWDHILFIGGMVLLAGEWRRAAKLITVFVVGHSLTLISATMAGWQVNPVLVDVVIVLSVVFVGGYGMVAGRPRRWGIFGGIVFVFGLVHGLGLATRFQALGVPEEGMLWRVIAFNVGIEIGQLTAIVGVLAVAAVISLLFGRDRKPVLRKGAYAALFGVGTVAAPLLAYQGFTAIGGDVSKVALPEGSNCKITERTETFPAAGGGHTGKQFYGPDEEAPMPDFGHSLGDGYIVVLYPEDLPGQELAALRDFVTSGDDVGRALLAAAHSEPSPVVKAVTVKQTMTCQDLHVGALREFSTTWVESLTSGA